MDQPRIAFGEGALQKLEGLVEVSRFSETRQGPNHGVATPDHAAATLLRHQLSHPSGAQVFEDASLRRVATFLIEGMQDFGAFISLDGVVPAPGGPDEDRRRRVRVRRMAAAGLRGRRRSS
jgi:hypothetical protein